MTSFELNPPGIEDDYLRCLNACFSGWGDRRRYDWYFKRKTVFPDPDLMVLRQEGELVAGSAVSYRRIALAQGAALTVGIMTGSWTMARARGQGCFARVIEDSVRLTRAKGGALLLAFVTEENASLRQLARAGAALFPSTYIFSTPDTPRHDRASPLRRVEKDSPILAEISGKQCGNPGQTRFIYESPAALRAQLIDRTTETEILRDDQGNLGIVEKAPDTDLLQWHTVGDDEPALVQRLAPFVNHALDSERKLFLFSTHAAVARAAGELGLAVKPGYVTALVADWSRLQDAFGTACRPSDDDSRTLAQPDSACYLGPWSVHSGDRT